MSERGREGMAKSVKNLRGWDEEVGISEDGMKRWAYQRMG